jgi:hypothetical protein
MRPEQCRSNAVQAESRYDERRIALAPYLEQLTAPLHPAIALEPWERSALAEALDPHHGNGDRWPALLAESLAFQSKYLSETDEMERQEYTSPESMKKHRERLTIDAAIGLALMEEIQRVIDATILSGKMGQAKRFTGFRNKLAQTVKTIKERISREAYEDAENMYHEMLAPLEKIEQEQAGSLPMLVINPNEVYQPRPRPLREPDEEPPKPIKLNRYANLKLGHAVEEQPNHSKRLLLLLGAAVLVWSILILPRMLREPIPHLAMPDLPHSAAILKVETRPPSLYVVVDGDSWNALPSDERLGWVKAVGQAAAAAGYTGASFRTEEGASVAQWLKQRGARLLTISGEGS